MSKALVLLSGGMDSTTLLYYVRKRLGYSQVYTISFNYTQRHVRELDAADQIVKIFKPAGHKIVRIDLSQFGGSPLTATNIDVPDQREDRQYLTVVPSRNSILLSLAAAYAETKQIPDIFFGANFEDFRSYPDCRQEYVQAISNALSKGNTYVKGVYAPFIDKTKIEIVELGMSLDVPWDATYSCYKGGEKHCMKCDACVERFTALETCGYKIPADLCKVNKMFGKKGYKIKN
jgi:7-cyano-7-deazaguanine synthase